MICGPSCENWERTGRKYECKMVTQFRYRPGVNPGRSSKSRFPDYMTMAQDGGKVDRLTHRPRLSQEMLLVLISVRG